MTKELLLDRQFDETRLALLEDDELCELYIERDESDKMAGNIYIGRVENVLPGMQAAFIQIGQSKNGFLYAGDIQVDDEALKSQLRQLSIRKLVRPGQEILVQVVKEPTGNKGARLTNNITLPGRMVVLLPTVGYVGVSRRISCEDEAKRLRALAESVRPQGMGLIVRTAAEGADEQAILADIAYLTKCWESIKRRAQHMVAPSLVHRDLGLVNRVARDMLLPDVARLLVEDREAYDVVREDASMLSPELAGRVSLYEGETGLFSLFGVDKQVERALSRRVWLKSGGYLVFDYTEALTVIDVNTGKFVGKQSLSDTVYRINLEAVQEIARQLRLRDIGGIIVIDFIDMDEPEHREQLVQAFRAELKRDRTKTNLVGMTGLGLVEMTRKKVHQPIRAVYQDVCPMCQGAGLVEALGNIARAAIRQAAESGQTDALIRVHPEVAELVAQLGAPEGVCVYVEPANVPRDQIQVGRLPECPSDKVRRVKTCKRSFHR